MNIRRVILLLAVLALGVTPRFAAAQTDLAERLSVHGSINMAWGKSDNLPTFGIDKDGTTEYRAVALQFGYKIDDNDRVVTQFLHRRNGTSPLNDAEPDFFPVWAFYEHAFDNGAKLKLGRAPLPRGLFNEVRFVGTLLPFYRVGRAVYGETLEQIDGAVLSKPFDVGSFRIETYAFAGGFDLRALLPGSSGVSVYQQRMENSFGTQVWVNTPIDGVRVGGYIHSYQDTPHYTLPDSLRGERTTTWTASAEGVFSKGFVRAEMTTFNNDGNRSYGGWYAQAGVKPIEKLTIATEYQEVTLRVGLPAPIPALDVPMTKELTLGFTWHRSPNVVFKLEGHRVTGYDFDVNVPFIIPPSAPPFIATLAPASKSHYILASVAVAF
jgi:hypothetical protein